MTYTKFSAIFTAVILLTGLLAVSVDWIQTAEADKSKGTSAKQYGSATKSKVCGDRLCSEPPTEEPKEEEPKEVEPKEKTAKEEAKTEMKSKEEEKAKAVPPKDTKDETMKQAKEDAMKTTYTRKTVTGTITSNQDPGVGHESHQLAIILPPSDKVYRGHLTYSATEPLQLVALHGPLKEGEAKGQATWSPDGKTKFALTFVDNAESMGMWTFSGNAIAVHTMKMEPFTVTYSVSYTERAYAEDVITGTVTSSQDPGLGHETHNLAIILPPRDVAYNGYMTYDASENIQLVTLVGPLEAGQVKGQATWTPDGKTIYGLMLIDPKKSSGSWQFSGNAVAIHTMNPEPFTVTYSLVLNN